MNIGPEEASSLKLAVTRLFDEPDGQVLLEFLEDKAGHFAPAYNPEIGSTIILAAGRTEMLQVLRNLNRLTVEQIVELCQEGQ